MTILCASVCIVSAQPFEMRILDQGEMARVQIRNTGDSILQMNERRVTDIVFGVKWHNPAIDFFEVVPGPYRIAASGGVLEQGGYHFQAFGALATPYLLPADWKTGVWVDIVQLKVHAQRQHAPDPIGRFALAEPGFHPTTDPNIGIDLIDATPRIVNPHGAVGVNRYEEPQKVELDADKYGSRQVQLIWTVTAVDGVHGYVVERRSGADPWEDLAILPAEGQSVCRYLDENAVDGESRKQHLDYRVRVVMDEEENVSDVKGVDFDAQKMITVVFPNPASDRVFVEMSPAEIEGHAYLEMYRTDGKLVYRNRIVPSSTKEEIDLKSFTANGGSYTIHLVSKGKILDARPLFVMR